MRSNVFLITLCNLAWGQVGMIILLSWPCGCRLMA